MEDNKTRYFKCVYNGEEIGRFSGKKPKQAANKALTSIIRSNVLDGTDLTGQNINFSVRECTRGSKHKEYKYNGIREKLENPTYVHIGAPGKGKEIIYNYINKVQKQKQKN